MSITQLKEDYGAELISMYFSDICKLFEYIPDGTFTQGDKQRRIEFLHSVQQVILPTEIQPLKPHKFAPDIAQLQAELAASQAETRRAREYIKTLL